MFDFIRGFVASKQPEYVVIDVGGVGFKIFTSMTSLGGCEEGETATFFTYLSVKEDDITLFGFTSSQELDTFKMLLDVSGVGPKLAVSVLSQMTVTDFSMAVAGGNHKTLSKLKGIGPKTAQKIVQALTFGRDAQLFFKQFIFGQSHALHLRIGACNSLKF